MSCLMGSRKTSVPLILMIHDATHAAVARLVDAVGLVVATAAAAGEQVHGGDDYGHAFGRR